MIVLRQLILARGGRNLLEDVDLTLHDRTRVGMIGANGSGKSSFFALLRGELHQESGDLDMPPRLTIAHVAQETPAAPAPAIEYVIDGDAELREIERELAAAHDADHGERLAELHARFDAINGYTARARAAAMMHGLGFTNGQLENPVAEFSGGWRMRLNLARALMCRSDVLLLDEPTNHLDLDAIIWLEEWLKSYQGMLMMISHDRDFLDNTVNAILHVDNRKLRLYTGNYADFERQRAASLALQRAQYEKQQREIAHLRSFVERFRAKATKARQAQSRLKALARMELISAAHVDSPFHFEFRAPESSPNPLLRLERAAAGYGNQAILHDLNLSLESGARVGLLGPNGAGKSTLIKLMAGILPLRSGARHEGRGLKIGYFAQHQLEQLRPDESPLQHLVRLDSRAREQDLRSFLGGFGFGGDSALLPAGPFSGGEKARLCLALLVWQRPNLLLLDEPTNHLDLEMRHALTLALQEYDGGLVVVSHDRHLLRTTTERLMLVANGHVQPFDGDLEDYRNWLGQHRAEAEESPRQERVSAERKRQRRAEAEARNRASALRRPLENQLKKLEQAMERLQAEKSRLDALLATSELYQEEGKDKLKECLKRQSEIADQLHQAEERWLTLHEELNTLQAVQSD